MFIDRHAELAFLNGTLQPSGPYPGALLLLYGRRRVGKTALLKHWAEESGLSFTYWSADKESPAMQRRSFMATMLDMPEEQATSFDSWPALWRWLAPRLVEKKERSILILDELSYVTAADPAILSALQHAWDHHLKNGNLIIVLCGSQITTMEAIIKHQSPLFGRFTGQWYLQPLPFYSLKAFFPQWSIAERVALYGIVGGVPAYLEWLKPELNLSQNIRDVILRSGSIFLVEPDWLLYDELRDLSTYKTILRAIAAGAHSLKEISDRCLISTSSLPAYLEKLQDLRFIERRLPETLTESQKRRSKKGRYHLDDPFFRFYFRFIQPTLSSLMSVEQRHRRIENELRSFLGLSFEKLAQEWIVAQARAGKLPLQPHSVGSHWSRKVQIDVVAINHETKEVLIGECKWGAEPVSRQVIRDLIEQKGPKMRENLTQGSDWQFHYAIFARAGLTKAAAAELARCDGIAVDLDRLDRGLKA